MECKQQATPATLLLPSTKCRYKVDWTVQGWTATGDPLTDNQRSLLSEFFFIGAGPGLAAHNQLLRTVRQAQDLC